MSIIELNLRNNSVEVPLWVIFLIKFYKWRNWSSKRLFNLPRVAEAKFETRLFNQNEYISFFTIWFKRALLLAEKVKNLPAMWKTQVWSLGKEDPLEKKMVTHASIAWGISWTGEHGDHGITELNTTEQLTHT